MMNGFAKMASAAILAGEYSDGFDNLPHYDASTDNSLADCHFEYLENKDLIAMYANIIKALSKIQTYQQCIDTAKVTVPYTDLNADKVVDTCEATLWALGSGAELEEPVPGFDWYDVVQWCEDTFPQSDSE